MMAGARVLLVEDEGLVRMALADALTDAGFLVLQAESGDAALALIAPDAPIDLVVTDMQMPGSRDGIAVASEVRQRWPQVAVIYVTGRPEVLANRGALAPHEAALSKPFGIDTMLSTARRLLSGA